MSNFVLPSGHSWEEVEDVVDSGCGIDYFWVCSRCHAEFYVNIDQDHTSIELDEGDGSCEDPDGAVAESG